jgi:hypothetical protein
MCSTPRLRTRAAFCSPPTIAIGTAPAASGELDARRPGAAGRTGDQHGLAGLKLRPVVETEPRRAVIHRDRRRLRRRQGVGRVGKARAGSHDVLLTKSTTEHGDGRADLEIDALPDRRHHPCDLTARCVGQPGRDLILTPARQHVGEGQADCGRIDQDLRRPGFTGCVVLLESEDVERIAEFV